MFGGGRQKTGGTAYIDNCGHCVGGTTELPACSPDCAGEEHVYLVKRKTIQVVTSKMCAKKCRRNIDSYGPVWRFPVHCPTPNKQHRRGGPSSVDTTLAQFR